MGGLLFSAFRFYYDACLFGIIWRKHQEKFQEIHALAVRPHLSSSYIFFFMHGGFLFLVSGQFYHVSGRLYQYFQRAHYLDQSSSSSFYGH